MRALTLLLLVALVACGEAPSTGSSVPPDSGGDINAQVETAVRKHLARRSDLDMSKMDLSIQNVTVQGETAEATVGFQVKDAPEAAMSMKYHLVKEAGEWVVQPNAGAGHGAAPPQPVPGQGLPPGHPPAGGPQPAQPLPPGHPPVAQ